MEFKGLENKVETHVGDVLLLQTENCDSVIGYVKEFSSRRVTLSHERPNNTEDYAAGMTIGNKNYNLSDFARYWILPVETFIKDSIK